MISRGAGVGTVDADTKPAQNHKSALENMLKLSAYPDFLYHFEEFRTMASSYRLFGAAAFAFSRSAASFARNFAMRPISFMGTGRESGKRIVPLLTS